MKFFYHKNRIYAIFMKSSSVISRLKEPGEGAEE